MKIYCETKIILHIYALALTSDIPYLFYMITEDASRVTFLADSPALTSLLPRPLILQATLLSYAVLPDRLSLHLKTLLHHEDVADTLRRLSTITQGKYFLPSTIDSISLPLSIVSVTSMKNTTSIRCRAPKSANIADHLFTYVGLQEFSLRIGVTPPIAHQGKHSQPRGHSLAVAPKNASPELPTDETMHTLLTRAATTKGCTPRELLQSLTRFRRPDQSTYEGCALIAELSVKQRYIVYERLQHCSMQPAGGD